MPARHTGAAWGRARDQLGDLHFAQLFSFNARGAILAVHHAIRKPWLDRRRC
jgi:hypothetical protein